MRHNNIDDGGGMTLVKKSDPKTLELRRTGTIHPHPGSVTDALFQENPFFDPRDLLQVRYEMTAPAQGRGSLDGRRGCYLRVSRPTVYQAQAAFQQAGLGRLLRKRRVRKQGHKLSVEVIEYVRALRTAGPHLTTAACLQAVQERFGITVHRRSLERALGSKKNRAVPCKFADYGGGRGGLRRTPAAGRPTQCASRVPGEPRHSHAPWLGGMGSAAPLDRSATSTRIAVPSCQPTTDPHLTGSRTRPLARQSDSRREIFCMPELRITPQHLERDAYLYIRPSTPRQVLENTESTRRQYALRDRAVALG